MRSSFSTTSPATGLAPGGGRKEMTRLNGPGGFAPAGAPAARGPVAIATACVALLIALIYVAQAGPARAAGPDVGTEAQRASGKKLYLNYCSQCHGEKGDGQGYAASHLRPTPRDFTSGKFKVRTTPTGALPMHQDLVNIIRRGMPYSSMPAWPNFTDQEVSDLGVLHHDLFRRLFQH